MSAQTPVPYVLPSAPKDFSPSWMNNYTRILTAQLIQMLATQAIYGTTLNLNSLPTSATGLPVGSVWVDTANSNVLKIVT